MEMHEIHSEQADPAPAPAAVADGGGGVSLLGAMPQLIDQEDGRLEAVAADGAGGDGVGGALQQQLIALGGGGLRGAQQQLIGFRDSRLQAAGFFLVWGCCVLTNATVVNPDANVEHKLVGFVVLTIGAWLALLTLAGAGAGQAAARAERFLRGFFF